MGGAEGLRRAHLFQLSHSEKVSVREECALLNSPEVAEHLVLQAGLLEPTLPRLQDALVRRRPLAVDGGKPAKGRMRTCSEGMAGRRHEQRTSLL